MGQAFVNGEFFPKDEAKISIFDRGFLFGDGVYEVVPVFGRKPFLMKEHLVRFKRSLDELHFGPVEVDFEQVLEQLLQHNDETDLIFYFQATRGQSPIRNHIYDYKNPPNVVAFLQAIKPITREQAGKGYAAITAEEPRWNRCDVKATALLPNVIHRMNAENQRSVETIFYDSDFVTEATSSNVFIVSKGQIITPPERQNILRGITRGFLIEELKVSGENVLEAPVTVEELRNADEVWVTSSTKNVVPIIELDGKPIGTGAVGPKWSLAFEAFERVLSK